jgi:multidrug efflux pump subunit AcrB
VKGIIDWFARNGVAANLLMFIIVFGGLVTAPRIKQEVFPEISTDRVIVTVPYPGASPEEVEETINIRVEEKVSGLDGVKRITSSASEGVGTVTIEALQGTDIREVLDDVKSQVDSIDTFPEEAEEPVVSEVIVREEVVTVSVHGAADERTLKRLGEQVRDELAALPEISLVEMANARPYEISIEVSEDALRRYGLAFSEIADAVRRSSLDLPGGIVRAEAGEILLRAKGQAYRGRDFARLVLRSESDGRRLLLGDVATVVDGFAETDQSARFDGNPAVTLRVFRVGNQSALAISAAVREYVDRAAPKMPPGIRMTVWNDLARILRSRLETLLRNGAQGLVLVFLTLALFLQFRLAIWVTLGIPMSFFGTLALMPSFDVSVNVLSLFCFILVLGIVVDDAIVIGENVYKYRERGESGLDAVVRGTQEVSVPVIFGVLTTAAAFLPMVGLPGATGKIMRIFPLVVVPTLLFSLVESQLVLPSHLSHVMVSGPTDEGGISGWWKRFQGAFGRFLDGYIDRVYRPSLALALEYRYVTIAGAVGILVLTVALVVGGWVRLTWFPQAEADNVVALLTMPQGTPKEVTAAAIARLETSASVLGSELEEAGLARGGAVRHVLASVGDQPYVAAQSRNAGGRSGGSGGGAHIGEVNLELAPVADRSFESGEAARRWRELTGPVVGASELTFTSSLFNAGAPVQIQLASGRMEHLIAAAERLKRALATYPGVFDVSDSFRPGKDEIKLGIRPEAEALGLSLADLARQVRQAFYGEETQRVPRGREDIKVMVRFPESERRSLETLEDMRIRTAAGAEVPFSTVATVERGRGYATIQRADRRRIVTVSADVDEALGNANEIVAELRATILPQLVSDYPGLDFGFEGEQREQREALAALGRGFSISLLVIYALMAVPLRSYVQPAIVMSAIPFGVVGAVLAHFFLGLQISFLSVFGIIALVGVVVNDSLVLTDFINRRRKEGEDIHIVIRDCGVDRFRPILLTSVTTFAGLVPLLLERSLQAQFLVPMAVSLGFGVVFATFVSLMFVPCAYMVLEDIHEAVARLRGRPVSTS